MTTSLERFIADALPQEGVSVSKCYQLDFPSLEVAADYLTQRDRPLLLTRQPNSLVIYGELMVDKANIQGPISMIIEGQLFGDSSHTYLVTLRPEMYEGAGQINGKPDMHTVLQRQIIGEREHEYV